MDVPLQRLFASLAESVQPLDFISDVAAVAVAVAVAGIPLTSIVHDLTWLGVLNIHENSFGFTPTSDHDPQ